MFSFPALVTPACHRQSVDDWWKCDDAHITRVQMRRAVADDVFSNGIVFFFENPDFAHIFGVIVD